MTMQKMNRLALVILADMLIVLSLLVTYTFAGYSSLKCIWHMKHYEVDWVLLLYFVHTPAILL